jgi:hypothetical protein
VKKPAPTQTISAAKQVAGFIAKFDPAIASLTRACRSVIRKRYPSANELVYDNYNALAIAYGPTEKTSEVVFSIAVYPRVVDLYFMYGRSLPDPNKLLRGNGTQGAFIRLESAETLADPKVVDLIERAVKRQEPTFASSGKGRTMVKSISAKQRPRRTK